MQCVFCDVGNSDPRGKLLCRCECLPHVQTARNVTRQQPPDHKHHKQFSACLTNLQTLTLVVTLQPQGTTMFTRHSTAQVIIT